MREHGAQTAFHEQAYLPTSCDEYGRCPREQFRRLPTTFHSSISDNPFGVYTVPFDTNEARLPDRAILQFFTFRAQFYVLLNEDATEASSPGEGLVRCDVADINNDWCGHIVLNEDWVRQGNGKMWHFIAISEAKSFTREECRNWAHYIPSDLEDVDWDLFFVLLIEWNENRQVWERVGLGKIFQAAFDLCGKPDEILLG